MTKVGDAAARQYPASDSSSSAARGTAIHLAVKRQIDALNDQRLRAEVSLWNSNQVPEPSTDRPRYGARGSLRVDILELRPDDVVCFYDLKTGKAGLEDRRMEAIAESVHRVYPWASRFILIELRPLL
jgi:hypothetical protein